MSPPIPPIADGPKWLDVITRAGERCECKRCPAHRRDRGGRCEREHSQARPLIAAPADPGPDPARHIITGKPLVAYCSPCYDHAVAYARKFRRQEIALAAAEVPRLF